MSPSWSRRAEAAKSFYLEMMLTCYAREVVKLEGVLA